MRVIRAAVVHVNPSQTPVIAVDQQLFAIVQHTKRAVFQGGYVWGQTLLKQAVLPSPSDYGWIRDDDLEWLP